jgi:uncharacterized membrane protein (DUF2068 family)
MQLASPPRWLEAPTPPEGTRDDRRSLVRLFRVLLALDLGLSLIGIYLALSQHEALPEELRAYVWKAETDTMFYAYAGLGSLLGAAVSAGLWFFQRWARYLASLLTAAVFPVVWFYDTPDVRSASATIVDSLGMMSNGAVLVFIWVVMRQEFGRLAHPIEMQSADQ